MSESAVDAYEFVCRIEELPAPGAALAEIGGKRVALVHTTSGVVHAVQDECTHGAVSLSEGEVEGDTIECWLHGSRFDLDTGRPLCPPATVPLAVYDVQLRGDDVFVDVTTITNQTANQKN